MKFFKTKKGIFFILLCLLLSAVLIVFNVSTQFQRFQINRRNSAREVDINKIAEGIKNFIANTNNLPTTSNPEADSFLPTLILDKERPLGGVNIQTLEKIQGYFDLSLKDPSGSPYLIGIYENSVYIYTNSYEIDKDNRKVYLKEVKIDLPL